ncbi:MAG: hypothetical protein OIF50_04955 [Flavobacteriaceae bacterium]|nr:hypothetical protein [Flavobacteriaceae bacterium]
MEKAIKKQIAKISPRLEELEINPIHYGKGYTRFIDGKPIFCISYNGKDVSPRLEELEINSIHYGKGYTRFIDGKPIFCISGI